MAVPSNLNDGLASSAIPPEQFSLFDIEDPTTTEQAASTAPKGRFSNFVVFVDESGDHGMQTVDSNYPVFVLAFCVFYKGHYCEKVVPALQKFKFNHFGHDVVVLHEHEIRKETGNFKFPSRQRKNDFLDELTGIIDASNFILISCLIDKVQLREKQGSPPNPYHLALGFCLDSLYEFLQEKNQDDALTHVIVECRGAKEDKDLELEFRRICDGTNRQGKNLPFDVIFADKKSNSAGLQLADLVARPIRLECSPPWTGKPGLQRAEAEILLQWRPQQRGRRLRELGNEDLPAPRKRKAPMKLTEAVAPTGNPQST